VTSAPRRAEEDVVPGPPVRRCVGLLPAGGWWLAGGGGEVQRELVDQFVHRLPRLCLQKAEGEVGEEVGAEGLCLFGWGTRRAGLRRRRGRRDGGRRWRRRRVVRLRRRGPGATGSDLGLLRQDNRRRADRGYFETFCRISVRPESVQVPGETPGSLQRRLLRYGEFDSVDDLATKVIAFINDYNKRATPFRWTYDGRPLQAA
jgi:hypothetical protein